MILIARKFGRLANRLYLFANFMALACRSGASLANPAFAEYAHLFEGTCADPWCRFPARPRQRRIFSCERELRYQVLKAGFQSLYLAGLRNWPARLVRLAPGESTDLDTPAWRIAARARQPVLVQGWDFRDQEGLLEYSSRIRPFFRPIARHAEAARRVAEQARGSAELLIGVHLRQGDYARFQGGEFYYSTAAYAEQMRHVEQQLAPLSCAFLVCSDAPQRLDDFRGLSVSFGSQVVVEDLYALAECDRLMGPPSTFSMWASYYGQVPLLTLERSPPAELVFSSRCYRPVDRCAIPASRAAG